MWNVLYYFLFYRYFQVVIVIYQFNSFYSSIFRLHCNSQFKAVAYKTQKQNACKFFPIFCRKVSNSNYVSICNGSLLYSWCLAVNESVKANGTDNGKVFLSHSKQPICATYKQKKWEKKLVCIHFSHEQN